MKALTITKIPNEGADRHEVEFRAGEFVAYGTYKNRNTYDVEHAPTQKDFDEITRLLDGTSRKSHQRKSLKRP